MAVVGIIATAFWAMLPAYVPNNVAVLVGGGTPIDAGRHWRGHRLLGDGKTWRGTVGGILAGAGLAVLLGGFAPTVTEYSGVAVPSFPAGAMLALPTGAMGGDIAASFLKRRIGRARGSAVPGLDQLDFVIGALVLTAIVAPEWWAGTFTLPVIVVIIVMTPILHVGTNVLAYGLGLKAEPW